MRDPGPQQVYVIQHELGPVKIGIAKNPEGRLSDLQVSCPFDLSLKQSRVVEDANAVERYLHNQFQKYHMRGEWFDIPRYDLDFEIPYSIDESGNRGTEISVTYGRDLDDEWAHAIDNFIKAMKVSKPQTVSVRRIREEIERLRADDSDEPRDVHTYEPPDLFETDEIDKADVLCSNCGHSYPRSRAATDGCPFCGSGSSVERYY